MIHVAQEESTGLHLVKLRRPASIVKPTNTRAFQRTQRDGSRSPGACTKVSLLGVSLALYCPDLYLSAYNTFTLHAPTIPTSSSATNREC